MAKGARGRFVAAGAFSPRQRALMSIHAPPSPGALERMRAQNLSTKVSAIIITLAALVLITGSLALWQPPVSPMESAEALILVRPPRLGCVGFPSAPLSQPPPSAPANTSSRALAADIPADTHIRRPDFPITLPALDDRFGDELRRGRLGNKPRRLREPRMSTRRGKNHHAASKPRGDWSLAGDFFASPPPPQSPRRMPT